MVSMATMLKKLLKRYVVHCSELAEGLTDEEAAVVLARMWGLYG